MTLDHAGLSVADLDAAIAFYERAFGFAREFEFALGDIRGVMLRLEDGGRLELFGHPRSGGGLRADTPLAAGASERVSPRPSPEPGVRFAFLADPEGNLVELVERT